MLGHLSNVSVTYSFSFLFPSSQTHLSVAVLYYICPLLLELLFKIVLMAYPWCYVSFFLLFLIFIVIRQGLRGMSAGPAAAPVSTSGGTRIRPHLPRPPAFPSNGNNPSVGLKPPLSPQTDSPGDVGGYQLPHQNSSNSYRERTVMTRKATDLVLVQIHTHWHPVFSFSVICSLIT